MITPCRFRPLSVLRRSLLPLLLLPLLGTAGCITEEPEEFEATALVRTGDTAPDFTVELLDGGTAALSALRGEVVLLTFFSTWCPTCREQMALMQEGIVDRFAGRPFRFLPVSRAEERETVAAFCRETGIAFPVGLDPDGTVYGLYATRYVPRNLIIDPAGRVLLAAGEFTGEESVAQLARRIAEALDGMQ